MQPGFVEIAVDSLLNHSNRLVRPRTRFPDDLALLAFTSGTTAQSKIVELSHGNLISDVRSVLEVGTAGLGDSLLSMLPLAHLFELTGGLLSPLACGARIVYEPSPLPNRIIGALHDQGITHALAVPGLVKCLVEEVCSQRKALNGSPDIPGPMASVRRVIGPSFHTLIVGGASLEADLIKTLRCADIQVGVGYGLTEAGPIVSLGLLDSIPVGSVGRPLPGVEVRLSEAGEILVRGGNVMRGYHRDPEASRSVFVDGWLRTGDLGTIDENGCLYLTGRLKELIITSTGETLDPAEMEVYYNHPKFAEIAVVGLRAADGNDEPVLFAVPSNKETADEVCQDVFTKLRTAAPARFRASRLIRLHQPLPRTATGKIRRVDLRTKVGALTGRAERK